MRIAEHAVGEVLAISNDTTEQARTGEAVAEDMRGMMKMAHQTAANMVTSNEFVTELSRFSNELKTLIESMGSYRRRRDRVVLDSPYRLSIEGLDKQPVVCRLMDISAMGLRVEARIEVRVGEVRVCI